MEYSYFFEQAIIKHKNRIKSQRTNFIFLTNGSMIYDYDKFDSYVDALVDAVKNGGEDLDDMISLVFVSTNSSLRNQLVELINE